MNLDDSTSLAVDDLQLFADVSLDVWLLDIVARMDGFEEIIQKRSKVALVEGSYGVAIFAIGLAFLQGLVYQLLIVVLVGKSYNLGSYEDIALA